ncbi:predicted protein [Botrytis cinerea T4]|uniref:Uncharacterized protein n=1 Tax=Botryotinia fuckeliana (strain T4) TaxID=999810 RepID=G2YWG2_BOTF4|nr:predicted protein [Botrytis cinerea T4]
MGFKIFGYHIGSVDPDMQKLQIERSVSCKSYHSRFFATDNIFCRAGL